LRRWRGRQQRERARHLTDRLQGDAGGEGGAVELSVAEQNLDDPDIGVARQPMRREAVAQRGPCDALVELGGLCGGVTGPVVLARLILAGLAPSAARWS